LERDNVLLRETQTKLFQRKEKMGSLTSENTQYIEHLEKRLRKTLGYFSV